MKVDREDPPVVRARKWAERWETLAAPSLLAAIRFQRWAEESAEDEPEVSDGFAASADAYGGEAHSRRARALLWRREVLAMEERERLRALVFAASIGQAIANVSAAMANVRALDAKRKPPSLHTGGHRMVGVMPSEAVLDPAGPNVSPAMRGAAQRYFDARHDPSSEQPKTITVKIGGHRLEEAECRDCGGSGAGMGPPGYDCTSCGGTGLQYE